MATTTARRAEKIDIRLTAEAKETLRSAAAAQGRTVSEFVLDSALQRAAETLPDRTRFELGAKQWAEFQALLDAPPRDLPRLATLLKKPSVFER
jgi:uncharacterized protein (DUF1778 family)